MTRIAHTATRITLVTGLLALTLAAPLDAQDGYFDPAWGAGGRLLINVGPDQDHLRGLLAMSDGKLLLFGTCGSGIKFCAARLRGNGSLDPGFGPGALGTAIFHDLPSGYAHAGAALPSGHALLAGEAFSGVQALVAQLTAAGALDATVGNGQGYHRFHYLPALTGTRSEVRALAVQADGKVLAFGTADSRRGGVGNFDFAIARLLPGLSTLDPGFGGGDGLSPPGVRIVAFDLDDAADDGGRAIGVRPDGRILLAGMVSSSVYRLALAQLTPSGQLDASFGDGGKLVLPAAAGVEHSLEAVAIDRQGRILIAGSRMSAFSNWNFLVARLLANGQLDSGFGVNGYRTIVFNSQPAFAKALALQSDGRIVVAGEAWLEVGSRFAVARLLGNGQLDPSFGVGGTSLGVFSPPSQPTDTHRGVAVTIGNGGLMVAGRGDASAGDARFGIARLRLDLIHTDGFQP